MEPLLGIGLLISTGIAADFLGISFLAVVPTVYILGVIYYQASSQKKEKEHIEAEYQTHTRIATLQKTSALTAYQTERAQKELSYINRMDYLSGRNDSVFWNQPPI